MPIELPIALPIVLPIVVPIVLPIVLPIALPIHSAPPARGRGVASCGPYATLKESGGSVGSAGEFREARF